MTNTGNVKLRGLQLLVPALAGDNNSDTIRCNYANGGDFWIVPDLAAAASLSCSGSFNVDQGAIEAGDLSPAVIATAANLAAGPVTASLPAISVPNTPSLSVSVDAARCVPPTQAGMGRDMQARCLNN